MTFQVHLSATAENDIDAVLGWFREQSALAAGTKWLTDFMARITMLETHPARFKVAAESDELGVEIREMILGKRRSAYRVHFMIFGREVVILRVRRSTQDELPVESLRALGSAWTFAGSKAASDLDRDE